MDQISEFFQKLTNPSDWPARWVCGKWTEFHGWLYITSDIAIWLAYFLIPVFLLQFVTKKNNVPLPRVFWLFGLFILLCGLTHLVDALMFWWPAYRFNGLLRFCTALVSLLTVVSLFKILPKALALKTSAEFDAELNERIKVEEKLNEYTAELEIKNKEIEHFAYIVSHDLREPLRAICNYAQILREDYSDKLDKDSKHYLDAIQLAGNRMSTLVKAVLDFSDLSRPKEPKLTDLQSLIEEVLTDLTSLSKKTGAFVLTGEMPSLFIYDIEIRQLFMNLISNAMKFHKEGSTPEIHIGSKKMGTYWQFSVSDNGIGIDSKHFEEIFIMFQRLNTTQRYEGNGIGLANCKKIIELHEGKIWLESTLGKGTTFYFTLREW